MPNGVRNANEHWPERRSWKMPNEREGWLGQHIRADRQASSPWR
jgi:hypothetical protein